MTIISINRKNKKKYSNGTYPKITIIKWRIGELDANILKNFPNLTELNCSDNEITDLSGLQYCTGLTKLDCSSNKITDLSPLQYCTKLTVLDCNCNQITDLSPLQYCTGLTELNCKWNQITDLSPLQQYCTGLTKLQCTLNEITDLSPLQYCTGLTELYCGSNQIIDLSPLQYCSGLTELDCSENQIIDLSPLQYCTKLTELHCCFNQIKDLNPLKHFRLGLTYLDCWNNQITDLSPLQHCTGLTELDCSENQITDLSPLKYCTGLTELHCSYNNITDLSPLRYCTGLTKLDCDNNEITSLEPLIYLERLTEIKTQDNPLNPPSIQVARFLERIERNNNDSIYSDTQNVHDVKVQQSVMDSVRNLMRDRLPNKITLDIDSVLNSELKASTKSRLLEYFEESDYHVILLITYKELFTYVWNRIINNPNRLELLKILDDNIQDSECKCFTGRFNRTLSTLVGFYDDIEINISDNSRISAIILQIKDSIIPYDPIKHRELSKISLIEAGYDSETVELWIKAIE